VSVGVADSSGSAILGVYSQAVYEPVWCPGKAMDCLDESKGKKGGGEKGGEKGSNRVTKHAGPRLRKRGNVKA